MNFDVYYTKHSINFRKSSQEFFNHAQTLSLNSPNTKNLTVDLSANIS